MWITKYPLQITAIHAQFIRTIFLGTDSSASENIGYLLDDLNHQSLCTHNTSAQLKTRKIDNVLVYLGNELSLWQRDTNNNYIKNNGITTPSLTGQYTRLKQISHIPLTLQSIVMGYRKGALNLREYSDKLHQTELKVAKVLKSIDSIFLDQDTLDVQKIILLKSIELLKDLVEYPNRSQQLYELYLLVIDRHLKRNMALAAKAQIQEIDRYAEEWGLKNRQILEKTRVLIVGPHGPRQGRVDMQYYTNLYETVGQVPIPTKLITDSEGC